MSRMRASDKDYNLTIEKTRDISNASLLQALGTTLSGLDEKEALRRRPARASHRRPKWMQDMLQLLSQFKSPFIWILVVAVTLSSFLGDYVNSYIILTILVLNGVVGFWQERKAGDAVDKLKSLVAITANVIREGRSREINFDQVVRGDIVELNAGDIIPGDGRLIESNDLHVNEAALTGESFPAEKFAFKTESSALGVTKANVVFQGTNVVNGTGTMVVISQGDNTAIGAIGKGLNQHDTETSFERGIKQFSYLLLQATLAFAILILVVNLFLSKPVIDSALFALSLAIGMTPEMLPVIITICLSMGAKRMAEKKVAVKKLAAIHTLGNIDIFCSDKTGTLTEGVVNVHSALDPDGVTNDKVLRYACWNAFFETGFTNPINEALKKKYDNADDIKKLDEVPYDFIRKRLSVVVEKDDNHLMITKGSVKNILEICTQVEISGNQIYPVDHYRESIQKRLAEVGDQGFRTLAVCYKNVNNDPVITKDDEAGMIFLGIVLLFDPPKPGIGESLTSLRERGVHVKLITGDNVRVAAYIGERVGLTSDECLTGTDLRKMSDEALAKKAEEVAIFAEMEPYQKERIVKVLHRTGHAVAFLGDGINDVSAMQAADVGISVDTAVDIAKETADVVLLEKNLDVLHDAIQEGRKTFGNTLKYIFITTSANFGNMVSVAGASIMLPFLPLLPKQILLINFLTDIPAMALASDSVGKGFLRKPKRWDTTLIRNFMIVFGLISAVFDIVTFVILRQLFDTNADLFRTAWFLECILTEVLFVFIIRSHLVFYKSKPGRVLTGLNVIVIVFTFVITHSPLNEAMGFAILPTDILIIVLSLVLLFVLATEAAKSVFFRKQKWNLNY